MTDPDRTKQALENIITLLLPNLASFTTWEYQVIASTPGPPVVLDLLPTSGGTVTNPFGPLTGLMLWPGPDGGVAVPTPGKLVRVRFTNGDPSKPEVCGLDPTDTPSVVYQYGLQVQIGSAASQPVAYAAPVVSALEALEVFATGVQTVLAQMVAGYASLTGPQITAWNAVVTTLNAALALEAGLTPTLITKAT